jgi:hypothetical protein
MVRFCVVVVSIPIHEKIVIWMSKETRKPAPVFAIDSIKLIERVWLVIEVGGVKDGCAVMPAAIDALAATTFKLLRDHAVVGVIECLEAGVSGDEDLNLFLRSGAS